MKKVLLPQKIHDEGLDVLEGKVETIIAPDTSQDTVSHLIKDADGVILRTTTRITRDMILSAPNLKVISRTGVGVDNIDVKAATEQGVMVCNLPRFNNVSVAEHTVALILSLAKAVIFLDQETRKTNWSSRNSQKMMQLKGKTLGIVGFGAIGSTVAKIMLNGFGMNVLAYDPYLEQSSPGSAGCTFCSLEDLMSQSHVVSVHLPATPETIGLLDERLLGMLGPTALLVNSSRGDVIDEKALTTILQKNKIAGAGLDVFAVEPLDADHSFLKMDNVVLTPHAAALTRECIVGAAVEAARAVLDVLSGVRPKHLYNKDVISGN